MDTFTFNPQSFPNLEKSNWRQTSESTPKYNCVAWAAGDDTRWWGPGKRHYWPPGIPREASVDALVELFKSLGFKECSSGKLEPEREKIVIYVKDVHGGRVVSHAARQLPCGGWTSKMGPNEDIRHESPQDLNGPEYGKAEIFMARKSA